MGEIRRLLAVALLGAAALGAQSFSSGQIQFFETQVQPILTARCLGCHNAALRTSGLALTGREALLEGGNRGPAADVAQPEASLLLRAVRHEGELKMPLGGKLPPEELAVLERWVAEGLPWTAGGDSDPAEVARSDHWAFQPIRRPDPPEVNHAGWVRNPIDRFILARLEEKGIEPSPEAGRYTLIRRLSLDLLGLPPSPEQIEQFVNDTSPDAYEKLVDRLLASPHYGERWGRHWLDVARYADSNGYNIDGEREIWMYRDWVIEALNQDMPFDQFVIEQMAGDLLPNPTTGELVASGFHRNTLLNLEGGIDFEQYRVEAVVDRVDTTGAAFLGLTLGCARCHDHKFDPISQREFYQLYSFFNNIDELTNDWGEAGRQRAHEPLLEFGSPEEMQRRDIIRKQMALLEEELEAYEETLRQRQAEWEAALSDDEKQEFREEIQIILATPAGERNDFQNRSLRRVYFGADLGWKERRAGIDALREREPKLASTMIMRELPEPRQAYVHLGGDFLRRGVEVEPGVPAVLPPLPRKEKPTRLDLARWLVSPENPLTARVTVNRIWQRYFGLGIVETENDFGTQGAPPSHPELLDWLASEFLARGWSLKSMHRLIVTSATYRQSSKHRPELRQNDPRNRLLSRQNRLRLEAEIVRDAGLAASGLLAARIGGPSVFPPQPPGASKLGQIQREWVPSEGEDRYRRGMYTHFWRSSPDPGLMVFDAPDSTTACTRRARSNTPLQALTLLNDEAYYEFAQALARRVLREGPADTDGRIGYTFRLCLSRPPKPAEQQRLRDFLARQRDDFQTRPELAEQVAADPEAGAAAPELAAWTAVGRVVMNLDEFITRE